MNKKKRKGFFTPQQRPTKSKRGTVEDVLNESARMANVEVATFASVNKICNAPAHSLEHGWLIDNRASCHMAPFRSDIRQNTKPY